jgi:two-component system nitrate/nitrite sensor histidine kinase NarX
LTKIAGEQQLYQRGKQSLIIRSGMTLGILVFISVLTMLVTFLTAESAENDAVRINLAGSLRMQSYRIAETLILNHSDVVAERIPMAELLAEFERRFYQPVLANHIRASSVSSLLDLYIQLETQWLTIKNDAVSKDLDVAMMLAEIDDFVVAIDQLVKMLEMQTENKLKLLRTLQGISMFVTVIVVMMFLFDLRSSIVAPLRQLVHMANKMRDGDFSMRINVGRDDELALLSDTLNMTASSLDAMYRDLEQKVQEKTHHLEQARDELGLLYETSRLLSGGGKIGTRLDRALSAVQLYFGAVQVRVELFSAESEAALAIAVPRSSQGGSGVDANAACEHRFAIERQGEHQGELVVTTTMPSLEEGQRRNLQLVADNIAAAFSAESQRDQQHRLVLMEERAVIARELHDSLAQNLSYLKIQISRFQMLQAKGTSQQQLDATVDQVKQGINAAYVQLRELLSTFRLQLSSQGLYAALEATVTELADRGGIDIELDYRLDDFPLTPNEEIHVLQIVREALSNVLRHSRAQHAYIAAFMGADQAIEVRISDDGQGFGPVESSDNHYGKTIMRERAQTLKGKIRFDNATTRGAVVVLRFVPDVIAQAALAVK